MPSFISLLREFIQAGVPKRLRSWRLFVQGKAEVRDCIPLTPFAYLLTWKVYHRENYQYIRWGESVFGMPESVGKKQTVFLHDLRLLISEIYLYRNYERYEVNLLPGDTVLDCGAHMGVFSVRAARKVGNAGQVVSFEPDPDHFDLLTANIKLNHISNIIPMQVAVSDTDTTQTMVLKPDHSAGNFIPSSDEEIPVSVQHIEVQSNTLDRLVLGELSLPHVDFIKMDIEGHEPQALEGAGQVIRKFLPRMAVCVYHNNGRDKDRIIQILETFRESCMRGQRGRVEL
jgi:FkbM family methyltransferase